MLIFDDSDQPPYLGYMLDVALEFLNYTFLEELPLEFLYVGPFIAILQTGFYMAIYGILSRYVEPRHLATRMALQDGLSTLANIFGVLPSAAIFNSLGYYGVYTVYGAIMAVAFAYNVTFVR